MAVKLRLKRMGAKQKPYYRIVAADSRRPRDGRFIEIVGTYNPLLKEDKVTLDETKILKWLKNGAEPTDTVKNILSASGLWAKFKTENAKVKAPKKEVAPKSVKKTTTKPSSSEK